MERDEVADSVTPYGDCPGGRKESVCWWDIMKKSSSFDDKSLFYETKIKHHHLILVHKNELLFKENMS